MLGRRIREEPDALGKRRQERAVNASPASGLFFGDDDGPFRGAFIGQLLGDIIRRIDAFPVDDMTSHDFRRKPFFDSLFRQQFRRFAQTIPFLGIRLDDIAPLFEDADMLPYGRPEIPKLLEICWPDTNSSLCCIKKSRMSCLIAITSAAALAASIQKKALLAAITHLFYVEIVT